MFRIGFGGNVTSDLAGAHRSRSASAASGLQPIVARPRVCVVTKNSALRPLRSNPGWHGRMITWGFLGDDFQG